MPPTILQVNTTEDRNDGNVADGLSLREAILIANNNPNTEYEISLTGGLTYNLTINGINEDAAVTGDLDIATRTNNLSIGSFDGQKATINASGLLNSDRIFQVLPRGKLNLQNLIITGGATTGTNRFEIDGGGGIRADEEAIVDVSNSIITDNATFGTSGGGGIYNRGFFSLHNSIVSNNLADGTTLGDNGGGIMNSDLGTLIAIDTTISDNQAEDGGGGIFNFETLTIINTTISSNNGNGIESNDGSIALLNSTISSNQTVTDAGGIEVSGGVVSLFNSTVINNRTTEISGIPQAAGIFNLNATVNLENTIVAGNIIGRNRASDLASFNDFSTFNGNNNNLIGAFLEAEGTVGTGTDLVSLDPLLGPLQNNGGFTSTHAPLDGSLAIDAGNNSLIPVDSEDLDGNNNTSEQIPFDQRRLARISNGIVDIGAVEAGSTSVLPTLSIVDRTVVEGRDSQAILTVNLSSASSQEVTVNYATNSGTATADSDYTSQNGTVTFAPNTTATTISIPIVDNNTDESDETFSITLSNPANATIQKDTGTITITNTLPGENNAILDIDGSGGQPTFARDGLLISAFLFFYQDDRTDYSVLDKFILDPNATFKTGNDIANILKDKLSVFDADGSGQTTFARDGLLISAFLFFYQDDRTDYSVLDKFILDENATRTTGNDVANYLKDLIGINAAAIYSDTTDKFNLQNISGTVGNDFLTGNSANERIFGNSGDDLLTGGSGKDNFVFGVNSDRDLITDFTVTEDLIQIDPSLSFSNSEAVFSAITNLGMVDDRLVAELVFDANNKITIFSDNILTVDNFFVNTTVSSAFVN
jgi:hypothetical protein